MIRTQWRTLLMSLALAWQAGADEVVWRMGTRDGSSAEFHQWIHPGTGERQIDYANPSSDAVYREGIGDWAREWPAYQPGSANGGTGFRPHPARVEFELKSEPTGDLELRLNLLAYSARLPVVQVDVNGKLGWYHQHPRLAYSGGDPAVFFQPHYSESEVRCRLPGKWFRAGTNHLVLTAVDIPGEREDVRPSGFPWPGNSGLFYDAVALVEVEAARSDEATQELGVRVEPTIFYRQRESGLVEEVTIDVNFGGRAPEGKVSMTMEGRTVEGRIAGNEGGQRDFGEGRVTLEMPAWEGTRGAEIRVESGGRVHVFQRELRSARRWQLWVIPHEHLDVGYTDYDGKVAELHSRVLDDAMDLAREQPGFQFTADGFWVVNRYLEGRDDASRARLVEAVKRGVVHVPVVHGSLFTGSASLEGLVRSLYPSRRFSLKHGTPFDVAIVTDVPSYSWSLASVLAASGVKYFVGASDAYRGPFLLVNRYNELGAHAWEGPDGGRVTTWYARHYHQVSSLFGLPPRLTLGRESLPRFLQAYDRPGYRSDDVILYGTQVENGALQPAQAQLVTAWNREHAFPRLRFGGFAEAMRAIERSQGDLTVVRGDGGPYWEDGLAANARVTALARENSRRLPSAEKMSTLATLMNPVFRPERGDLELAWEAGRLIDEHTWHADCSVRDPESQQARRQGEAKDARAYEARRAVDRLMQRSLSAIADQLPAGPGTWVVFNPLNWARGGVLEGELGRGQMLVDSVTGKALPWEVLREGRVYQTVRWMVPEVPGLGFRCFAIRPVVGSPKVSASEDPNVLESPHYRVLLDAERGGIRSLVERSTGKEWVSTQGGHALGQWLYVTGGDALPNRLVQYSSVSPIPDLTIHEAGNGRCVTSYVSGLGAVARMESSALNCPKIETEVVLPFDRREVRITVKVRKEATLAKEAAYVVFPWALEDPKFRYATPNGFVDPARDMLPGGCQEWYAIQDWVSVEGGGSAVVMSALDAPLVTLGYVVRGTWPEGFGKRRSTVYSYVMSNYTPEGYAAAQGGDFVFRYVITSGKEFDAGAAARAGAEAMTPLETVEITRSDKLGVREGKGIGLGDGMQGSGMDVTPSTVQVVAWKGAESGRGTVVRMVETGGKTEEAMVTLRAGAIRRATRCTAVEDDLETLPVESGRVRVRVPAFGIVTVRLE